MPLPSGKPMSRSNTSGCSLFKSSQHPFLKKNRKRFGGLKKSFYLYGVFVWETFLLKNIMNVGKDNRDFGTRSNAIASKRVGIDYLPDRGCLLSTGKLPVFNSQLANHQRFTPPFTNNQRISAVFGCNILPVTCFAFYRLSQHGVCCATWEFWGGVRC